MPFNRKLLNSKVVHGEVPGTLYGLSRNGWINRDLSVCPPPPPHTCPLMLLLDGHYCPETVRLAAETRMSMFALPPRATHVTQPLDRGPVNSSLERSMP